jgi:hypothetical protein
LKVTIQYFEGCPHWRIAEQRLRQALKDIGRDDVSIDHQRIDSPDDAERLDFHGSPTLLIDGRDPFAGREMPASLGCRVYQTEEGTQGAPSVAQIRHVLRTSSHDRG